MGDSTPVLISYLELANQRNMLEANKQIEDIQFICNTTDQELKIFTVRCTVMLPLTFWLRVHEICRAINITDHTVRIPCRDASLVSVQYGPM